LIDFLLILFDFLLVVLLTFFLAADFLDSMIASFERIWFTCVVEKDDNMEFHGRVMEKHQEVTNDGRQPTFHIDEFKNIYLFESYLSRLAIQESNADSIVLDTLLEYERRGYYRIENNFVGLTEKGLAKCNKPVHDWD
jgi:hypothetical protein